MTCNLWNFYENLMHLVSSTIQRCGIFIWLPPLPFQCLAPNNVPTMYSSPNYTHYFFEFANEIFIHSLQFLNLEPWNVEGLCVWFVWPAGYISCVSLQRTLVYWKYRKPMFHHCLFFRSFGATLWSRIQGYGSRDEFWLVTTMKNRRNEISGHLQQSCTLKLNIGVPLLVATMLQFVAKIYKLVHACSGIKETISSICWQTIPQRQGVAVCPERLEPGKVRDSCVILSSVIGFYQKLFQSITGCSSCWFTSLECSPPSLQITGLHLFPIVASYHWQKQKWDQQMTTCPS